MFNLETASREELIEYIEAMKSQQSDADPLSDIVIGQNYLLDIGMAHVVGFYDEDEHNKVQFQLHLFRPDERFISLMDDEPRLSSMPIPTFIERRRIFERDQRMKPREVQISDYA